MGGTTRAGQLGIFPLLNFGLTPFLAPPGGLNLNLGLLKPPTGAFYTLAYPGIFGHFYPFGPWVDPNEPVWVNTYLALKRRRPYGGVEVFLTPLRKGLYFLCSLAA